MNWTKASERLPDTFPVMVNLHDGNRPVEVLRVATAAGSVWWNTAGAAVPIEPDDEWTLNLGDKS